ncbi:hypothetical protein EDB92DRAFT_1793480 [Lactarius akahatsu]|uniref:Mediator of RNA polymerase II transcription subunit 8 n=1 Tax=Lactarius akahatsu TaxID=416441 RepID=A0AAD4LM49_9AGAM|nr:hypothetical protein EDB92DRAFT_1793480 [Lactarius akahatsu]
MTTPSQPASTPANPSLPTLPANLGGPPPDVASLESIKFRVTQLIDSIRALAWQLEAFHPPPPWPELLAKYAVVMAQAHNLSRALASSPLASMALHPRAPLSDASLDSSLIPLLRNQQTTDVLRAESATVRRLGTALGLPEDSPPPVVLDAVSEVVVAHDARAERAQRAVAMLREKYDWRVRVAVDPDEVWSDDGDLDAPTAEAVPAVPEGPSSPASGNTSDEEEELENVLGTGLPNSDEDIRMLEG